MDMTRATVVIAAGVVVSLVAAAAGIGAYIAVRQSAPATSAADGQPVVDVPAAAALHGIDPRAVTVEPGSGSGIAVASTEQIVEPADAAGTDRSVVEAPETLPQAPSARPAAPAPAPARRAPTRPAPAEVERPAPPPVPAAAPPEPEPRSAPESAATPARRPPAPRASRDLPAVDGWIPADPDPSTSVRNTPTRDRAAARNLPPPASANFDAPVPGAGAEPPLPVLEELLIPADAVIGLQIETFVTTDHAEVEDDVQARVTRDVMVARHVAIPAGSLVNGSVVMAERGGKLNGASRLGVRFHTVVLNDGVEVPIATETVYREGRSRGRDNAARIGGGAVAGAILGAIFGGGRGAAIGGAAGAAGGTAAAAAGDAEPATLAAGTTLTVRLARPSRVTVASGEAAP